MKDIEHTKLPISDEQNSAASRRTFLRFVALTGLMPLAGFFEGCSSHPGSRATVRKDLQSPGALRGTFAQGKQVIMNPLDPFPHQKPVKKTVKWDFDRLIYEIETRLEEGQTTGRIERFLNGDQEVTVQGENSGDADFDRFLNIIFNDLQPDWIYEDPANPTEVVGMRLRGCMLRDGHTDTPKSPPLTHSFPTNCQWAKKKKEEHSHKLGPLTGHLVYSSSSSYSSWT